MEPLAWIWGLSLMAILLKMGIDVGRNVMMFWLVSIAVIWLLGLWLSDKGFTVFGNIYNFFANLNASYSPSLGLTVSIWLTIPFVILIIWSRINDKWRFTHNKFEHQTFGKVDWSISRGAKTVRTSYPDILEAIILLAGDLIIYDARGSQIIRRIPHVPLLPLVRRRINVILKFTAVTTPDQIEDELEDDVDIDDNENPPV